MPITWENYLWDKPKEAPDTAIAAVEQKWGIRFPDDYRAVVRWHQGQTPTPSVFRIGTGNDVFNCLLHFMDDAPTGYHIMQTYAVIEDWVPKQVYPFGETPGGNYICFDFRTAPTTPTIVHVDHEIEGEDAITRIASTFTEMLESLRET